MHRATSRFWKRYNMLPDFIQSVADKNFDLLKENQTHPSLRFKRIGKIWSVRIGIDYRA